MKKTKTDDLKKEIVDLMKKAGWTETSFFYERTRPKIQRDGLRYEILSVSYEDDRIYLDLIPDYMFTVKTVVMDKTWRKSSWNHVRNLVADKIANFNQ